MWCMRSFWLWWPERITMCFFLYFSFLSFWLESKVKKRNYSNRKHVHSAPHFPTSKTTQVRQKIYERKREILPGILNGYSFFLGPKWLFIISVGSKPFFFSALDWSVCVCVCCVCCVFCVHGGFCVYFLLVKPMMPGLPTNYFSVCLCIV